MFGKIKNFATKKLLERQLKDAPPEQREMILTMMEKDPKLFEKIAKEIEAEKKKGSNDMTAAMKVMPKYQAQLQKLLGNKMQQKTGGAQFNANGTIRK